MKAWKRKLSMAMSLIMLAGTLGNSGFTVMAADDEGPLQLKEGEEWVSDDAVEEEPEDGENSGEEAVSSEETEEAASDNEAAEATDDADEEAVSEDNASEEAQAEDDTQEEPSDDKEGEDWKWVDKVDNEEDPTAITEIEASVKVGNDWHKAEVTQGSLVSEMNCIWPAVYTFEAVVTVDGKEYKDTRDMGFGPLPTGHDLNIEWKLNDTEDAAWPFYEVDTEGLKCNNCDDEIVFDWTNCHQVSGEGPRCGRDISVEYEFEYHLMWKNENGEWEPSDVRPFTIRSGELMIPATGVHNFMKNSDSPGWDWQVNEETGEWDVAAKFWCGDCGRDIWYTTDDEELSLDSKSEGNITTYTATFHSDKFYNSVTRKLDRSVNYTAVKKVTDNAFEISGVEDVVYNGNPVTFNGLWIRYRGRDLQEGIDYTLKYKNNKNAGQASLTISGKGKFSGSVTVNFNILQADIKTENFFANDLYLMENGKAQKQASVLYWNGKPMAKGDYKIEFNDKGAGAYRTPGRYIVTITAKGKNFTGSREYSIHIIDKDSGINASKAKVTVNADYLKMTPWGIDWELFDKRDDDGVRLAYKVTLGKDDITSVFEECNLQIDEYTGKGTLTLYPNMMREIDGKRYGGTISTKVEAGLTDISSLEIDCPASVEYLGEAIDFWQLRERYRFQIKDKNHPVINEMEEEPFYLNPDEHFTYKLKNNKKPGTMTLTITGKRGYSGKIVKKITIAKPDLSKLKADGILMAGHWWHDEETDQDYFDMPSVVPFSKGGAQIDNLSVGRKMENNWIDGEGEEHHDQWEYWFDPKKDYSVKYTDNTAPGKKAKLTITGKGNYTGSITYEFEIEEARLWDTDIDVPAVALGKKPAATMKPYLPKVTVTDIVTGKKLEKDKDYTVKYLKPTFSEEGDMLAEDQWIELKPDTKWSDVFKPGDENLVKDGHSLVARITAKEGSGYNGEADYWYGIVKSPIKAGDFKLKAQALALNEWGDPEPWGYFMPGDEQIDLNEYLMECSDAEYKAWADKYFDKYPTDCRFMPLLFTINNADKPGTASVKIEVLSNWEWDCNTGCRGGSATVKFKVVNKNMVK